MAGTPKPTNVYAKIAAVQAHLAKEGIAKSRKNQTPGASYNFRGIDEVYNTLSSLMAEHGLCILPRIVGHSLTERGKTSKGNAIFSAVVEAEFDFVSADDGSIHVVRTYGEAMDSSDKATNKAMSAAYKYMALMTFAIPTEGDNDADAHTPEVVAREPARQQQKLVQFITDDQRTELMNLLDHLNVNPKAFFARGNITDLRELPAAHFAAAKKWINDTALAQRDAELKKQGNALSDIDGDEIPY